MRYYRDFGLKCLRAWVVRGCENAYKIASVGTKKNDVLGQPTNTLKTGVSLTYCNF